MGMVQEQDHQTERKVCTHICCLAKCLYEIFLPSDGDNVDDIETPEGVAVEVATCSQSSAEPTFAHTSVADAYKDEQYCMAHISRNPQPNTGKSGALPLPITGRVVHVFISSSSAIQFLCSSQIRTDQWEDQESVPYVEGAKGVSQS